MDLVGVVFERLTVLEKDPLRDSNGSSKWICKCECGTIKSVLHGNLRSGHTKSCGCIHKESSTSHGLSKHPLYKVYMYMKKRCNNIKDTGYARYGGRGIKVCDSWLESFENFYEDMKDGYKKGLELDRRDNNKGYSKENCRWVTSAQNNMNRGSFKNSSSKYKGVTKVKSSNTYKARIYKGGKTYNLGTFTCEKEAAEVYNKKALELFKEYANFNKIG